MVGKALAGEAFDEFGQGTGWSAGQVVFGSPDGGHDLAEAELVAEFGVKPLGNVGG